MTPLAALLAALLVWPTSASSTFILNSNTSITSSSTAAYDNSSAATAQRRRLISTTGACTLDACHGINLLAQIKRDLKPWIDKGSITPRDIDDGEKRLQHVEGFIRVSIIKHQLYASHLGKSWGTRDGVFLVSLLEMMRTNRNALPEQVEFVLSTMDRVQLPTSARTREAAPFALSFATSPGYLDVPIPDPSFWAWPENLIAPYWELLQDPQVLPWKAKTMRAFCRWLLFITTTPYPTMPES